MRRELDLDDFQPQVLTINVTQQQGGGKQQHGTSTQYQSKDMRIQTMIRNSEKTDFKLQVSPAEISAQQSQQGEDYKGQAEELEMTEQLERKTERFLRKVGGLMEKELAENMPLYSRMSSLNQAGTFKRESKLLHTLQHVEGLGKDEEGLEASCVSWNSTGVIVAAGYSHYEHQTACSHKGLVCLWGIFKRAFKPTKPDLIHVPNCVSCISFHPKKPSVLAVGTVNGQVLLYELSKSDTFLGRTIVDDYFHRDCVTQLSWWAYRPPGRAQTNHNLLSLAADGKILLWEVPNQVLNEDSKNKTLLKYPIKGFLMLRKKQNVVIPVSGLSMSTSPANRSCLIIGSEGGSVLQATLVPINHHSNTEGKINLDIQTTVKFKPSVYPFLLNIVPKHLREVKSHVQKVCKANKIDSVDSIATVLNTRPQLSHLYPNPIRVAYEPMNCPITSISHSHHGLFIVNAGQAYTRIYVQGEKEHIESIEEGEQWAWIAGTSRIGGFVEQDFVVVDWVSGELLWSVSVGEAYAWIQSSLGMVAVLSDKTKIKVLEIGDKLLEESNLERQAAIKKIGQRTEKR